MIDFSELRDSVGRCLRLAGSNRREDPWHQNLGAAGICETVSDRSRSRTRADGGARSKWG